tara:strand:+ start:138 stop:1409 length:1272 start_codon:yes stop_codon:yes gene_type:complete
MEGENGIESSWRFVSHALRFGAGVAVHLSKLRPKGTENGKGLVASGPVSFAKIYSVLNETLRRGGIYKNGACVAHIDLDHPDVIEFITAPRAELAWIKRCVNIDDEKWKSADKNTREALIYGIKSGDIWLNKIRYDQSGQRIYGNVCLEVYLPSRGTCLLQHINLSACSVRDIQDACVTGMSELCELHGKTGVGSTGEYLASETDRQVGLGFLGLANLLRREGITYEQFGRALSVVNNGGTIITPAEKLAYELKLGVHKATTVAINNNMVRAFAIAPTASCSYRSKDLDGYTACPEIAPPISRTVDRDSGTFGVTTYDYGDVEIASKVGWDAYKSVADGFMTLLGNTGLLHGYSFNSWSDVVAYDEQFVEEWLRSPQTSLYYSLQVMGDVQDKSSEYAALDEAEVNDYLEGILNEPPTCDCQE